MISHHKSNVRVSAKLRTKTMNIYTQVTSISRASRTASGIGSSQNSSGTKCSRMVLITGALNEGHTFKDIVCEMSICIGS